MSLMFIARNLPTALVPLFADHYQRRAWRRSQFCRNTTLDFSFW
jgi:hypothetical protein